MKATAAISIAALVATLAATPLLEPAIGAGAGVRKARPR